MTKRTHKYNAQSGEGKRSLLEVACDKLLQAAGIVYEYESYKIVLTEKEKMCSYNVKKGVIKEQCTVLPITYTPDFVGKNWEWVIETKGMETPDFLLKWKLFKIWLAQNHPECKAYIAHTQKDILATINHINSFKTMNGKNISDA